MHDAPHDVAPETPEQSQAGAVPYVHVALCVRRINELSVKAILEAELTRARARNNVAGLRNTGHKLVCERSACVHQVTVRQKVGLGHDAAGSLQFGQMQG